MTCPDDLYEDRKPIRKPAQEQDTIAQYDRGEDWKGEHLIRFKSFIDKNVRAGLKKHVTEPFMTQSERHKLIKKLLRQNPKITMTELCKKVRAARSTLQHDMRRLGIELHKAKPGPAK